MIEGLTNFRALDIVILPGKVDPWIGRFSVMRHTREELIDAQADVVLDDLSDTALVLRIFGLD